MTVIAQVSQPYVTIGRMIDLYICSLLAALRVKGHSNVIIFRIKITILSYAMYIFGTLGYFVTVIHRIGNREWTEMKMSC